MKRILLVVLAVILVGGAVAVYFLLRNLDALVEAAIETYGSQLTGTPVSVEGVELSLREGRATVRGLRVGNPKGFEAPYALAWDEVSVDLDPESLASTPYVLDEVVIGAPDVVLEVNEKGQVNLRVLQQRLQSKGSGSASGGGGAGEGGGEEPRLRIDRFSFERGALESRTAAVGGKDQRVELPPLRLRQVGGPGGATPAEIGRTLLSAYIDQSLKTLGKRELGRQAEKLIDKQVEDQLEGEDAEHTKKLIDRFFPR